MKNLVIGNCMKLIRKKTDYNETKLKEIEYGLMSIYLTFSKLIIISIITIILGIFKEMIIFLFFFNFLRMPAFGLHATKSWICLLSSSIILIILPYLCINLNINIVIKLIVCLIGIIFMFKNAPADTEKRPIVSKKRRKIYKTISTIFAVAYSILAIIVSNQFISNCLIFALILENLLISPLIYKLFKLPYNNYITYLEKHPELQNNMV